MCLLGGGTWCQVICHTSSLCLNSPTPLIFMEMARDPLGPQVICHTHPVALSNSVLSVMFMDPHVCQATCHTHYQHPTWSTHASKDAPECQAICFPSTSAWAPEPPFRFPQNPQLFQALLQMTFMLVLHIQWSGLPGLAWPALCHHRQPIGGGGKRKLQIVMVRLAGKITMCNCLDEEWFGWGNQGFGAS